MNTIFLTSSLELSYKDEFEIKHAQIFGNKNNLLNNFKKYIKKYENFLLIASNENDYEITDMYANITFEAFNLTLPFKNYTILDGRNKKEAKQLIKNADFVFLCGGHVPTQNKFFEKIKLKKLLKDTDAVICGVSAGSMNSADIVYAQPELEGEVLDCKYKRYLNGLSLTKVNIIPHFTNIIGNKVDGITNFELTIEDSYVRPIIAYSDGSYILISENKTWLYGKAYIVNKGQINEINDNDKVLDISDIVEDLYN